MKYRNHIHFVNGKKYLYISDENLQDELKYAKLHEMTYLLDNGALIVGMNVTHITTEENDQ